MSNEKPSKNRENKKKKKTIRDHIKSENRDRSTQKAKITIDPHKIEAK